MASNSSSFAQTALRGFSAYARWLDSISWKRFILLSVLAMIAAGMLSALPPFNIEWGGGQTVVETTRRPVKKPPVPPVPPVPPAKDPSRSYEIHIDKSGVHITPVKPGSAASAADSAGSTPAPAGAASASGGAASATDEDLPGVHIALPEGADTEEIRQAIEEAQQEIVAAMGETRTRVRHVAGFVSGISAGFVALFGRRGRGRDMQQDEMFI